MKISHSILGINMLHLESHIKKIIDANCDQIHIDIFDGVFVPTLTFDTKIIEDIKHIFPGVFLDVHLCTENSKKYAEDAVNYGADLIYIHIECFEIEDFKELKNTLNNKCKLGVALSPETEVSSIKQLLEEEIVTHVNIMSISPGYGGKLFQHNVLTKIDQIRSINKNINICIDGGVNEQNMQLCADQNVDIIVMGSALKKHLLRRDKLS